MVFVNEIIVGTGQNFTCQMSRTLRLTGLRVVADQIATNDDGVEIGIAAVHDKCAQSAHFSSHSIRNFCRRQPLRFTSPLDYNSIVNDDAPMSDADDNKR